MKKDRDCGMQYMGAMPMMPMMPIPNQMPNYQMPNYQVPNYQTSNQTNELINQIINLEKRVSTLENLVNNTPYNNSNYQMM